MSNTSILRRAEGELLPPGYERNFIFSLKVGEINASVEVDGFNPNTGEAIEICLSETEKNSPKSGQRRKLDSDVLKLVLLRDLGIIQRGKIYITSIELSRWLHQSSSWHAAACKRYDIAVELRMIPKKRDRKRIRHTLMEARREQRED